MEEAGQGIPCAGHFLRRAKRLTFSADIKKADHIGLLFKIWWVVQGSNLRPSPCKGDALPAELTTRENGGADGTRTRDPRRDRPVF